MRMNIRFEIQVCILRMYLRQLVILSNLCTGMLFQIAVVAATSKYQTGYVDISL